MQVSFPSWEPEKEVWREPKGVLDTAMDLEVGDKTGGLCEVSVLDGAFCSILQSLKEKSFCLNV